MVKHILFLLTGLLLFGSLSAQDRLNWKKHRKLADEAAQQGNFAEAADHYQKAWEKKPKKEELIFKAGEAYYRTKNYRKAVEAYRHVKNQNDDFPLVGLKYARSLKQDAQYDKAKEEFQAFFNIYSGPSKAILEDIIQTEIRGCELGKEAPAQANRALEVVHLGGAVNSDAREFAAFPTTDSRLLFSSTKGGPARIYSAQGSAGQWSKANTPENFPLIQGGQFAHPALSPDGSRLYFTICEEGTLWDDLNTRCEIYALFRQGAGWSEPQRLPTYINTDGVTATHPNVVHVGGLEILYFSSNREGGRGGLDIWYASRDLGSDGLDFTFPVNLGPAVNTYGDEISPFYDVEKGRLYFSSNGHVSIGGFDVFVSMGDETSWGYPENAGMPVNSSADDYFFALAPNRTGVFLSSNRVFGGEKITTTHDDIFFLSSGPSVMVIRGDVYNQQTSGLVNDFTVSIFRVGPGGQETPVGSDRFTGGAYRFEVGAGQTYRIEVNANGYLGDSYTLTTNVPGQSTYGRPLYLEPIAATPARPERPVTGEPERPIAPERPADGRPVLIGGDTGASYTARGRSDRDNAEFVSSAPRYQGAYYKVQLIALRTFDPDNPAFDGVRNLGRFDTEKLVNRNLNRILLADFFTLGEARNALQQAQRNGFPNAYIVEYKDGERYGKLVN